MSLRLSEERRDTGPPFRRSCRCMSAKKLDISLTSWGSLPDGLSNSLKMGIEAFTFMSRINSSRLGAGVGIVIGIHHTSVIKKPRGNIGTGKGRESLLRSKIDKRPVLKGRFQVGVLFKPC